MTVRPKAGPPRERVLALTERERDTFVRSHQRSRELYERSADSLFGGVPMSWMMKWAGGFPVFADSGRGLDRLRRGRQRVRGLLPRRYRGNDGARSPCGGRDGR